MRAILYLILLILHVGYSTAIAETAVAADKPAIGDNPAIVDNDGNDSTGADIVNLVVVLKSDRVLRLMHDDKIFKEYPIALGLNPLGHKRQEGDWRTPEGRYILDWRNEKSRFYRSMHISYPNLRDVRRSEQTGVDPGGMIMIHGSPNQPDSSKSYKMRKDWTTGCIAVTNREMDEIWNLVHDGTPIVILP